MRQILSTVIASHHSGLIDCITPAGEDVFSRRMNKAADRTHFVEAREYMSEEIKQKIENIIQDKAFIESLNAKLKSLHETGDSSHTMQFKIGLLTRFLFS